MLQFLGDTLDDSFEVYFNPYLNGDRPDVIIMRKGYGVMVIEVKDWDIQNFELNEKKQWVLKTDGSIVKSPIYQVLRYKHNLFDLHVDDLLELKIKKFKNFNIVACVVYFHCARQACIEEKLVIPFKNDEKYYYCPLNFDFSKITPRKGLIYAIAYSKK